MHLKYKEIRPWKIPCSIGKAWGKRTDLRHVSAMSSKKLSLSVSGARRVHPMYTTHAHDRCLREMRRMFFSMAHSPMYNELLMAVWHWKCSIPWGTSCVQSCARELYACAFYAKSLLLLHRTALCQKPFRPEILHSTHPLQQDMTGTCRHHDTYMTFTCPRPPCRYQGKRSTRSINHRYH